MADEVDEEEDEDEGGERGEGKKDPRGTGANRDVVEVPAKGQEEGEGGERFVRGREGSMPDFSSRATVEWMWV